MDKRRFFMSALPALGRPCQKPWKTTTSTTAAALFEQVGQAFAITKKNILRRWAYRDNAGIFRYHAKMKLTYLSLRSCQQLLFAARAETQVTLSTCSKIS